MLGSRLILSRTATPPIEQSDDQRYRKVYPGIEGLGIDNQRLFKSALSVSAGR